MRNLRLGCALAALMAIPTGALAQSTGSQEIDEIVVTAAKRIEGVIVAEQAPKSRASIGQDYIEKKQQGQSILQLLNLTPGYNFVNNDPYGNSGGNVRIRGFDGPRISLTQDGIPLNDTGNYAIFSGQQIDSELIERATVNIGTTDVDSPSASAAGGTINYITRKPTQDPGAILQGGIGTENYRRGIAILDSGAFGPFDTTAWVSGSYTKYDKFKGPGSLEKVQGNFRVFQKLGDSGDFVSVIGNYNQNRNNFFRNLTLAQSRNDRFLDRDATCVRPAAGAGTIQDERNGNPPANTIPAAGNSAAANAQCSNYFELFNNPSNTGNIRGQGRFTLTDGVTLTVDPSYQYVLANGGGSEVVAETDVRLQGSRFDGTSAATRTARGVDLNGDGDIIDSIRLYRPNNTNTNRYGLNASLIWEVSDEHRLRVAYAFDRGHHKQDGEFGFLTQQGGPQNVFGGRNGTPVVTLDGTNLQTRDRRSVAILNQVSGEYRGKFFDDKVDVSLGVRAPFFKRELNQKCFTLAGAGIANAATFSGSGFAYCTAASEASLIASGQRIVDFGTSSAVAGNALRRPFQAEVKYDKVLPNVGVTFRPFDGHQIYASYAEQLSAPRTDDLYDIQLPNIAPETTEAYDLGYRYQRGTFLASGSVYYTKFNNRIVRAFDQDQGVNITRNVGRVDFYGFDGQAGFEPVRNFALYGTFSYTHTEVKGNTQGGNATTFIPTSGKELVETPKYQYGVRGDYTGEVFSVGLEFKHVGRRFSTDVNDEVAPGYNVVDLNARIKLDRYLRGSYIQFNANNLFDENYLGNISSRTNAITIPAVVGGSTQINGASPEYSIGAPQSFSVTLRVAL